MPPPCNCRPVPGFYENQGCAPCMQVVETWCGAYEPEAWGCEAAAPRIACLAQYQSSMSAVLVWLTGAVDSTPADGTARSSASRDVKRKSTLCAASRVRTPRVPLPALVALSVCRLASWPVAAPALCGAAVRYAVQGWQGATCRIPEGGLQHCRRRARGGCHGAGVAGKLRCAVWRPQVHLQRETCLAPRKSYVCLVERGCLMAPQATGSPLKPLCAAWTAQCWRTARCTRSQQPRLIRRWRSGCRPCWSTAWPRCCCAACRCGRTVRSASCPVQMPCSG